MSSFRPARRLSWQSYASECHVDPLSISIGANPGDREPVRVGFTTPNAAAAYTLTAERARELAAELVAAADASAMQVAA